MTAHSRETYQPASIMRSDRGIFNGSMHTETGLSCNLNILPNLIIVEVFNVSAVNVGTMNRLLSFALKVPSHSTARIPPWAVCVRLPIWKWSVQLQWKYPTPAQLVVLGPVRRVCSSPFGRAPGTAVEIPLLSIDSACQKMRVCMWESQWLREFILEAEGSSWSCRVPVFKNFNSPLALSLSLSLFACLAQTTLLRRLQCISKGIWQVAYHYLTEFTQISQYHADAYHLTCWCTVWHVQLLALYYVWYVAQETSYTSYKPQHDQFVCSWKVQTGVYWLYVHRKSQKHTETGSSCLHLRHVQLHAPTVVDEASVLCVHK